MAYRYFEGVAHAALYAKFRVLPPPPLIHRILSFVKEQYGGPLELAYDVGTGSGQLAELLSPHFLRVVGTDVSPSQIQQALERPHPQNISFRVTAAETIPEKDASVQLITSSQAAHWFHLPTFYQEGARVLVKGGVMCHVGYQLPQFHWAKDPSLNSLLDEALLQFYGDDLASYVLEPSREVYLGKYGMEKYIPSFATEFKRDDSFYVEEPATLLEVAGYCTTWSGFQNFVSQNTPQEGEKLVTKFLNKMMTTLEVDSSETILTKRTNFFLLMARK